MRVNASRVFLTLSNFLNSLISCTTHSDIVRLLTGKEAAEEGGDYEAAFLERLSEDQSGANGTESLSAEATEKARRIREESMREHYHNLVYPAPRTIFDAVSHPLSDATLAHMQEEESRRIERPNLAIPVNGSLSYVTLAQ